MAVTVLVVGAGPVGLTMAIELVRQGVKVRIIDMAAARTDKSKALIIWPRTLELLSRSGPVDAFISAGLKITTATIRTGETLIAQTDLTDVDSPFPFALSLPQSETERLLDQRMKGFGIQVERQVELLRFAETEAGVTSILRHPDGREETVESGWLIGCDGAHSAVRHGLGMQFEGDTVQNDFILADVHIANAPGSPSEISIYWHRDGVLLFFPISGGRYRVIADIGASQDPHPHEPALEDVQSLLDQRGPEGIVAADPIWLSAFRINERKVRDYRRGRIFLAGDAAHVHSPAGGQGMNTGMQDAFNLAWKLALVCQGKAAPGLLDSYSPERSAVGRKVLADAGRLTAIATLRNPAAQAVRNMIGHLLFGLQPVRHALATQLSEIAIGYPESPLNGPHASGVRGPAPGERIAPVRTEPVVDGDRSPKFALFASPQKPALALISAFPDLLESTPRPPLDEAGIWLARPDGYVAAVAQLPDTALIADYLSSIRFGAR